MGNAATLRTPRYLLRRALALRALKGKPACRLLEIGCGTGELLPHLVRRGHTVVGYETSPEMVALARIAVPGVGVRSSIVSSSANFAAEPFDGIVALEVLEHIEDDRAALAEWTSWVRPGGFLLLTVPAHMKNWTRADEAGGHYRRYERADLVRLMNGVNLMVEWIWNYGFPLTAATVPLRRMLYRTLPPASPADRTAVSALDSIRRIPIGGRPMEWANELAGKALHWCQLPFLGTELGDGYLIVVSNPA